jgi:hypothetical protein
LWFGLGVTACLADTGCARLRSFRSDDHPLLGSAVVKGEGTTAKGESKTAKSDSKPTKPVDLYAENMRQGRAQAAALAQRGRDAQAVRDLDGRPADRAPAVADEAAEPREVVALQAPVPLNTADEGAPTLASRTTSPRWRLGDEAGNTAENSAQPPAASEPKRPRRTSPADPGTTVESLVAAARDRLEGLTSYQVRMNRQERVGSNLLPEEDVLLSIRRAPKAVRIEWPDGPHTGREVIYAANANDGLMHVNMADSIVPVPRLALPPDSPMVLRNSRHPITEAGFETIVENIGRPLRLAKVGDASAGTVSYGGLEQPEPLDHPCHKVIRVTPTGETWLVYFDPRTNLPTMLQANAPDGGLLERYVFRDPRLNVAELARADAFDVTRRWGESKGLLQRLARSAGNDDKAAADTSTR